MVIAEGEIPFEGASGNIKIDRNGQRTVFSLDIIKVTKRGLTKLGSWDTEKRFTYKKEEKDAFSDAKDLLKNATLKVTTIINNPYMMKKQPENTFVGNDRYEGFCKDLLEKLSERFGFKFIINPVKDGGYGNLKDGEWNGMVGELLRRLRWLAVGWMEMRLSMLLDVSMCLAVWSNDSGININPKILCPEGRPRVTTPADDRFLALSARRRRSTTVPQLVVDHFVASGRKYCYYGAKTPSQCRSLCNATSCVCPPQRTTGKGPLMLGKRTRFLDQAAMGFCTLHRRVHIHSGERFRASADLEGTTHQMLSMQHS
ncbi:Glutamate receptor ionotropic, kainate 2 [Araneus ventricosus]|uniref:Glutamate receptor ionotropic, kainate 2 n=1 Tax=Araneus ventricosus TaxID=182803 RepID=A0A4Y2PAG2_ARAVE|nr:Glutamate receptor ionotropic, kainate 2 [Araneus ventricosus]